MEELEQEFNYDKEYISDCMGWEPATAQKESIPAESAAGNGFTGKGAPCCLILLFLSGMLSVLQTLQFYGRYRLSALDL